MVEMAQEVVLFLILMIVVVDDVIAHRAVRETTNG